MVTKKGELSVKGEPVRAAQQGAPPPARQVKGLSDVDQRYRQRYVDLIVNDDARSTFLIRTLRCRRSATACATAATHRGRDPGAQPQPRPGDGPIRSSPHYNALDLDTYLRIALELRSSA